MDDVKDALGSLLVDEPAFELRGDALAVAGRRQRRHHSGWVGGVAAAAAVVISVVAPGPLHHAQPTGPVPACEPEVNAFDDGTPGRAEMLRVRELQMVQALCRLLGPGSHVHGAPYAGPAGGSEFSADGFTSYDDSYKFELVYERDGRRDDVSLTIGLGVRKATDTCLPGATCTESSDGSYASVVQFDSGILSLRAFQPDGTAIIGSVTPAVAGGLPMTTDEDLLALLRDPRLSIRAPIAGAPRPQSACGQPAAPVAMAICAYIPGNWRHAVVTEQSPTFFELTYLDEAGIGDLQFDIGSATASTTFWTCDISCRTHDDLVDGVAVSVVSGDKEFVRERATVDGVSGRLFAGGAGSAGTTYKETVVGHVLLAGMRAFPAASTG